MSYDEFADKLRLIKADFLKRNGRQMLTISELDSVLVRRLVTKKKTGLKSLKGFT